MRYIDFSLFYFMVNNKKWVYSNIFQKLDYIILYNFIFKLFCNIIILNDKIGTNVFNITKSHCRVYL